MPVQITRHRSQGRHLECATPEIKCGRMGASLANDAEKEVPRMPKEEEMKK